MTEAVIHFADLRFYFDLPTWRFTQTIPIEMSLLPRWIINYLSALLPACSTYLRRVHSFAISNDNRKASIWLPKSQVPCSRSPFRSIAPDPISLAHFFRLFCKRNPQIAILMHLSFDFYKRGNKVMESGSISIQCIEMNCSRNSFSIAFGGQSNS